MAKSGTASGGSRQSDGKSTQRCAERALAGAAAPQTITIRVPLTFGNRGGRKLVLTPSGAPSWMSERPHLDKTLIKALARAHRWKGMIESGRYASVTDLAAAEKINDSYLCRMLRLTLLAPDIVEAALDGRLEIALTANQLIRPLPVEWDIQRTKLAANLQNKGSRP